MPKGVSSAVGHTDGGDPDEGALGKHPDLPFGPRQCAWAPETAGAQQERTDETPAGDLWEHAGQSQQRQKCEIGEIVGIDVDSNNEQ